jgi:hypothetical protein
VIALLSAGKQNIDKQITYIENLGFVAFDVIYRGCDGFWQAALGAGLILQIVSAILKESKPISSV